VFLPGQAVSLLGDGLAVLAFPLLVLELTRSPLISGLSAASVTLGYLAVGLPAGVLVDRLDAWRVLATMDAARTAAFAALYLLWVTGAAPLWVIMTIAAGGAAGRAQLTLVPLRKPPNSSDSTIRATIRAMSQIRQPMSLGLRRFSPRPYHLSMSPPAGLSQRPD
jgi:MFS family permease